MPSPYTINRLVRTLLFNADNNIIQKMSMVGNEGILPLSSVSQSEY